eukprot:324315-Rhodomonas_salina.1
MRAGEQKQITTLRRLNTTCIASWFASIASSLPSGSPLSSVSGSPGTPGTRGTRYTCTRHTGYPVPRVSRVPGYPGYPGTRDHDPDRYPCTIPPFNNITFALSLTV